MSFNFSISQNNNEITFKLLGGNNDFEMSLFFNKNKFSFETNIREEQIENNEIPRLKICDSEMIKTKKEIKNSLKSDEHVRIFVKCCDEIKKQTNPKPSEEVIVKKANKIVKPKF